MVYFHVYPEIAFDADEPKRPPKPPHTHTRARTRIPSEFEAACVVSENVSFTVRVY
jgi:hypothetical protein